jgi:hypothetical protein
MTDLKELFGNVTTGDKFNISDLSFKVIKRSTIVGADFKNKFVYFKLGNKCKKFTQNFPVIILGEVFAAKSTDPKFKVVKFEHLCSYGEFDSFVKEKGKEE